MKTLLCCCCWWCIIKSPLLFLYEVLNHSINLLSASSAANKLHWAYPKKKQKTFSVRLYIWFAGVHRHTDEVYAKKTCIDKRCTIIFFLTGRKRISVQRILSVCLSPALTIKRSSGIETVPHLLTSHHFWFMTQPFFHTVQDVRPKIILLFFREFIASWIKWFGVSSSSLDKCGWHGFRFNKGVRQDFEYAVALQCEFSDNEFNFVIRLFSFLQGCDHNEKARDSFKCGCTRLYLIYTFKFRLCVTCVLITFDFFFLLLLLYFWRSSFSLLILKITIQQQKPC